MLFDLSRRNRIAVVLLMFCFPTNAGAQLDVALVRAIAEGRLIIAVGSERRVAARLQSAKRHPSVAESLATFILTESGKGLVVIDPSGETVIDLPLDSDASLANALLQVRTAAPVILRSAEQRLAGDTAAADATFGTGLLLIHEPMAAAGRFEAARRAFEKRNDVLHAQQAEVNRGFALFAGGDRDGGELAVRFVMAKAASADVAAAGWISIGAMRRIDRHAYDAVVAYRKAYEVAGPGSEELEEARDALAALDDEPLPSKEGPLAEGTMRILAPARRAIAGKAYFIAEADPSVARVDFLLDGAPVGTSPRRPFRVRIDLGPSPRVRSIKAIAYDAAGRAIAESATTVNDRADALRVTIVAPLQKNVSGNTLLAADVTAPEQRQIAHVDFFWKEQLLARIDQPPYRVTRKLPAEFGYLRVVATLDDGTSADDTRVLNATATAEEVDVRAVTFLASAVDDKGNVVRGLTSADFIIEDAGTRIGAAVRSLEGEPVTIGLAIDSSGSMQLLYLSAVETASAFIDATLSPADRIFLVSFDSAARLVALTTSDEAVLHAALQSLRPAGGTSLWDGIAFSLQQLQEIPGRKALVVISDGIELTSGQSAESCARLARTLGIPIYSVVPPAASRGATNNFAFAELARATGGEFLDRPPAAGLPGIFAHVRDTVRGQYLVSFTARPGLKSGSWRALTLRVRARRVTLRSVSGYYVP